MSIIDQYLSSFDFCTPIVYKGLTVHPFTVRQIRECNQALHCLSVDPLEFHDLSLLPLKRLDLILTVINRKREGDLPEDAGVLEVYDSLLYSFSYLINTLFPQYMLYEGDPLNEKRKRAITLIDKSTMEVFRSGETDSCDFVTLTSSEFEELSDLILYQNGVDVSYKEIPPILRQEAKRMMEAMAGSNRQRTDIEQMIDIAFLYLKDMELVMNLPVRKFYNLIDNIRRRQDYEIYSNPMYKVKDRKHWMFGGYNRSPYEGILQREEEALHEVDKLKN